MLVLLAQLRWMLMVVCLVLLAGAFGAMLVSSWRHHRRHGAQNRNFHASAWVELSWLVAPIVFVLALVSPALFSVWD